MTLVIDKTVAAVFERPGNYMAGKSVTISTKNSSETF